jgi:DNA-directed RNA polymerase specialized sigma24 family protein
MVRKGSRKDKERRAALVEALERRQLDAVLPLAWQVWYRPLAGFLLRHGVAPSELEDAMQDLFARMVEGWERFDGANLAGWLYSLARYETLTRRTERRREEVRERLRRGQMDASTALPADPHVQREVGAVLARLREGLGPVDALIYDALGQGLDDTETAAEAQRRLGVRLTPAGIRNRRYRLRKELVAVLEGEDGGDGS